MAGKRFSDPTAADETTTINNVKITDSEYTSDETKKTVSDQKTAETEKMMNSTSTSETTELITSPVTGGIDDTPIDNTDSDVISQSLKTAEVEQLKYAIKNNPDYFEEIGMNPDDLLSGFNDTGLTSSIYQEEEFTSLGTVIDENGFSYIETEIMMGENITPSNVTITSGQNISGVPPRLIVSTEFAHPMGKTWPISSGFEIRLLKNEENGGKWTFHSGVDFGTVKKKGVVCYAIYDGKISDSSIHSGYGNTVYLNFTYKNKKFIALYGHLEKSFVIKNQEIKKGDPIGIVGNTGGDYPIHLHFEIKDLTKKKWFNFRGSINNTYKNRRSRKISDRSLAFINGSSTDFSILSRFDGYLDPAKFLNTPSDFV
jgi:murein DD-endopeptidase MepM/ murein hydrolase activator NlpD